MAEEKTEMNKRDKTNEDASLKPDPETLNTTDPQEHMKGPLSSLMHKVEEKAATNNEKDALAKEEKDALDKQNN
jgi:hypothetical protein